MTLIIPESLQKELDEKLISVADVEEVVRQAEASGDVFFEQATDVRVASMVTPGITLWVEYRETGPDTFEVLSAYYHRMRFHQGE